MTVRSGAALLSVLVAAGAAACASLYEVGIETPIQAKLDVAAFQRVLVPAFLAGGSADVDTNTETVRLLRSQLRTKSELKVIDADVFSLVDVAQKSSGAPAAALPAGISPELRFKSPKDFEPLEPIFADVNYWKKMGEEYQSPLIVTGELLFTPIERSGYVEQPVDTVDQYGRHSSETVRQWVDRKGFSLTQKIIFIDGRTGIQLHTESYTDETLYGSQLNTPALSAYFELMDRRIPDFLNTLSSQRIRGIRYLLK